MKPSLINDNDE